MAGIDGKGALFKNDRKTKETQPDWTGVIDVTPALLQALLKEAASGTYKARISGWTRKGPQGTFLSLSLNAPFAGASAPAPAPARRPLPDDDIPF